MGNTESTSDAAPPPPQTYAGDPHAALDTEPPPPPVPGDTDERPTPDMPESSVLSDDQKRAFIRDGYVLLRGIVPPDVVADALAAADAAFDRGMYEADDDGALHFYDEAKKHDDISRVLRRSPLLAACDDLLGEGNARDRNKAQIAFRLKDENAIANGFHIHSSTPDHKYHIDGGNGKFKHTATGFSALIGVCLSEGQHVDELRGQFTIWPGSHYKLHEACNDRVRQGVVRGGNVFGAKKLKPDIGPSMRVLMRPGDAVIAHQRLGHAGGINVHDDTRKNLYFRVSHKDHDEYLEQILNGPVFTEYEGLHHLLPEDQCRRID